MLRRTLSIIIVAVVVGLVSVLGLSLVTAQDESATRSFDKMTVGPGDQVMVTITASNYGSFGEVTETLPAGFKYVSSPKSEQVEVVGQKVFLTLQGDTSITYTVVASDMAGSHTFSGMLRDSDRNDHAVGGASSVTVQSDAATPMSTPMATQPPAQGGARATRSFDMENVDAGDNVVVTITASNYGSFGEVTETLPAGFKYVSSPKSEQVEVVGQKVFLTLQGDTSITYTVAASDMAGSHTFSGMLRDSDRNDHAVGGASSVTVVGPYATRSFSPASVSPGGRVTVTIMASNYGSFGEVTETLPAGFKYVSSPKSEQVEVVGQKVFLTLQGDTSIMYTVTASRTTASYDFSGTLRDSDRMDTVVGGASSVSVRRASTDGGGTGGGGGSSGGSGGGGATGGESTPAPAVPADNPPIIAGGTREEFNVSENMTAVTSLSVVDGRTVTWNISGGFDAAEFTIGAESGALTFKAAPDFENPTDEGANNVYVVEVGATDSDTLSDTLLVLVTVTDVVDESTATPEPMATPEPTAEPTATPTAMPTLEPTAAPTLEPAATSMPEPTATSMPEPTATAMPVPTATSMPVATATSMPVAIATSMPAVIATSMPEPTATSMPEPTATSMPAPTAVAPEEPGGGFPILVVVLIALVVVGAGAAFYIRSRR